MHKNFVVAFRILRVSVKAVIFVSAFLSLALWGSVLAQGPPKNQQGFVAQKGAAARRSTIMAASSLTATAAAGLIILVLARNIAARRSSNRS